MHEMDPNFPDDVLDKVRDFLSNDDVFACPQNHFVFIHEMKIEAALITNDSPYAEVRAVVSNTDDPTIPCVSSQHAPCRNALTRLHSPPFVRG